DALHGEDGAIDLLEDVDELPDRRWIRIDHIVAEDHGEWLRANHLARHEHRMTEAERLALADVREVDQIRDFANFGELIALAPGLEKGLELDRHVEVIFDRVLAAARHENDVVDAGRDRLFHAGLNNGLVNY